MKNIFLPSSKAGIPDYTAEMNLVISFFLLIVSISVMGLRRFRRDDEFVGSDDMKYFGDDDDNSNGIFSSVLEDDEDDFVEEDEDDYYLDDDFEEVESDDNDDFFEEEEDDAEEPEDDDDLSKEDLDDYLDDEIGVDNEKNIKKHKKHEKHLKRKKNKKHKKGPKSHLADNIRNILMKRIAHEMLEMFIPHHRVNKLVRLFKLKKFAIVPICTLEGKNKICCKIRSVVQVYSKFIGGGVNAYQFLNKICFPENPQKVLKSRIIYERKLGPVHILCRLKIQVKKEEKVSMLVIHPIVEVTKGKMKKVIDLNPSIMKSLKKKGSNFS